MSEKIYACMLHFLAPRFHRAYGEEAIRLVGDRCRDEQGVVGKIRLWFDLLADLIVAAIRDSRFTRQVLLSLWVAAHAKGPVPTFAMVRGGFPHTVALFAGGVLSLCFLVTLSVLISQGRRGQAPSPSWLSILSFSAPTSAASQNSRSKEQKRSVRAPLSGIPHFRARVASGSLTAPDAIDAHDKKRVLPVAFTQTTHLQDVPAAEAWPHYPFLLLLLVLDESAMTGWTRRDPTGIPRYRTRIAS